MCLRDLLLTFCIVTWCDFDTCRLLLAVQDVCVDNGAVIKDSASDSSSTINQKKKKQVVVPQVGTKPVRPSLTQVLDNA